MNRLLRSLACAGGAILFGASACWAAPAPPGPARHAADPTEIGGSDLEICGQVTEYTAPDGATTDGSLTMVGVLQPDPHQFTILADAVLSSGDSDQLTAFAASDSFTCLVWTGDGMGFITELAVASSQLQCGYVDRVAEWWRLTVTGWGGDVTVTLTAEAAVIVASDSGIEDRLAQAEQLGAEACLRFAIGADGVVDAITALPLWTDIADSSFYREIKWLYVEGITTGCTDLKYCPRDYVRRDQMASFLVRALDLPPTAIDFFDDDEGNIHEAAINRLAASGITGGCDVRQYCPGDYVRRDQMASFLKRALDLPASPTDSFTDDDGNIHEGSINALAQSGITGGCSLSPPRYCPASLVTREQMAAYLYRGLLYPLSGH